MTRKKENLFENALLEMDYLTPKQPEPEKQPEAQGEQGKGFIIPQKPELFSVHKQYLVQPSTAEGIKKAAANMGISENRLVNELFKQFLAGNFSTSDNIN